MALFKECQQLNLKLFECPSFLFVLMGLITISAIIATYFFASHYAGPETVISAVTVISIFILIIGHFVIRSVARIAQAHQIQSEFIAITSHQLRTPLSMIKWAVEAKRFDIIEDANRRMLKLVNDLLNTARIEQGRFELNKEEFNLADLIKATVKEFVILAKASNAEIICQAEPTKVYADKTKIKMVLENLIQNAIQYNPRAGRILIKLADNIVSVQDQGAGIPQAQQKYVFQKFFRARNILRHKTQGTGLGLFIAKAIIESHKGKIWFTSQENHGTTFFFSLPLIKKHESKNHSLN